MESTDIDWAEANRADEVMATARRIFGEEDRWASGWIDHTRLRGPARLFVCAVDPERDEIESLDREAERAGLSLTVVPVTYSHANLMGFYERTLGTDRPRSDVFVSFGMDPVHNALCLRLRSLDQDAIEFFKARIPAAALRIEVEPRAGHAVAL